MVAQKRCHKIGTRRRQFPFFKHEDGTNDDHRTESEGSCRRPRNTLGPSPHPVATMTCARIRRGGHRVVPLLSAAYLASSSTIPFADGFVLPPLPPSACHTFPLKLANVASSSVPATAPSLAATSALSSNSTLDYGTLVQSYSELAMENRGTALGMEALEILGLMSARRTPYQLSPTNDDGDELADASDSLSTRNVVVPQRDLLPKETIDQVKDIMATIEANGWLATNLDSVDNLPSLHVNLVSGGEPIFPSMEMEPDDDDGGVISFENSIGRLWRLVKPHLTDTLLPSARSAMGSSTLQISDVFIRRYGEDIQPGHAAAACTRNGISAHFDVTASTTSVVALDDVAAEGKSGLYTTENSAFCTNHAALRRYFPLNAGDAVIHTWDVLHGVEIDPGQQRTSLIVWFEDRENDTDDRTLACPPWLANPSVDDDVGQFVLAIWTESVDRSLLSRGDDASDEHHPHDLYIRSAARGNALALTSLGSLCNEGSLSSSEFITKSRQMLRTLRDIDDDEDDGAVLRNIDLQELANELWYEAAIRGNPLAQTLLADEYMGQSMELMQGAADGSDTSNERANYLRLKATTLFALAGQQGFDDALKALPRVLNVESSAHETVEEFYSSPVFQTAQAVLDKCVIG